MMDSFLGRPERPVIDMLVVHGVTKQLLRSDASYERILRDARWLHAKYPGETSERTTNAYLAITRIVTIIGRSSRFDHARVEAGHLIGMLSWLYAASLPNTKEERSRLTAKRAELDKACKGGSPTDKEEAERQIAASNFTRLYAAYSKRSGAIGTIREQFTPGRNTTPP